MNYAKQERWTTPEIERLLHLRFRDAEIADFFSRPKTRRNRQVAWVQISERLQRELPLPSGDARSVAQCEQKVKNLRKEYLRVRFYQGRLERGEVVGSLRLSDYWPLLEATLGAHVDAKKRPKDARSSPTSSANSDGGRRRLAEPQANDVEATPSPVNNKRRREEAAAPAPEAKATAHRVEDGDDEQTEAERHKRSRQSREIRESVERLNRLVDEFMGPDVDVDASQKTTERRLAALEDDMRLLRASVSTLTNNVSLVLARLADSGK